MGSMNDSNNTSERDNAFVELVGNNSPFLKAWIKLINSENRLLVDSNISDVTVDSGVPSVSSNYVAEDINASTGGVARSTNISISAWIDVYSYSGSGKVYSWLLTLQNCASQWLIRFIVDGNEIFGSSGMLSDDVFSSNVYDLTRTHSRGGIAGITGHNNIFQFTGANDYPMKFDSSVVIKLKRVATEKAFVAGLMGITKD